MKTMLPALCFLLFTSGSVTLLFPETVHASGNNVLRDLKGDELRPRQSYYMVSSILPLGGGVSLDKIHNHSCALDVISLRIPLDKGLPVKLSILNDDSLITEKTPVSIRFDITSDCASTTEWGIDYSTPTPFVTIGGDYRNAFFKLIPGYFGSYKIMTTYTIYGRPALGYIGLSDSLFESRRLVVSQQPFTVSFQKVIDYNGVKDA